MATSQKRASTQTSSPDLTPETDLVYQALEAELGGVEIYTTALTCVQNDELREEWEKYLDETQTHVEVVRKLCTRLGLDPDRETPSRQVVRTIGKALVKAMQLAKATAKPAAAQVVAAECVTLAETKDHGNWSLIGKLAEAASGKQRDAFQEAYDEVENEEDEHLYHSRGWARELALEALSLPAQLPPPEEEEDVKTEEEAVQAKQRSEVDR